MIGFASFVSSSEGREGTGAESERCIADPTSLGSGFLGKGGGTVSGRSDSALLRGGNSGAVDTGGGGEEAVSDSDIFLVIPCPGLFPRPVTSPGLLTTLGTTMPLPAEGCIKTGALSRRGA